MIQTSSKSNCFFCIAISITFLVLLGLVILYFIHFHGPLSDCSSDWANMSTFITGFGTMLFTGLNVWVVWSLTKEMNKITLSSVERELQIRAINNFNKDVYAVFSPIEGQQACEVRTERLEQFLQTIKRFEVYKSVLPTFGSTNYNNFIESVKNFGVEYHLSKSVGGSETHIAQEAFKVFINAQEIDKMLMKDIMG